MSSLNLATACERSDNTYPNGLPKALGNVASMELDAGPAAGFRYKALCSSSPAMEITRSFSAQHFKGLEVCPSESGIL